MELETIAIPFVVGAATSTLYIPEAGKRFAVYYMHVWNIHAIISQSLVIKSGSTALTGQFFIPIVGNIGRGWNLTLENGGLPVLLGDEVDEALVLVTGNGTATIGGTIIVNSVDY